MQRGNKFGGMAGTTSCAIQWRQYQMESLSVLACDDPVMPLVKEASEAGTLMMYHSVDVLQVREA